jgi:hypothetical protein
MDNNAKLPIKQVRAFLTEAEDLGCYSKNQRYNFETAWALILKALTKAGLSETSTVETIVPKIEGLLREHGRTSSVSADSLKAYRARIKRLLGDFVKYNGGDFMAWKEELAKSPAPDEAKPRKRRRANRSRVDAISSSDHPDAMVHRLIVRQGVEGKMELPTDISKIELESIWKQLDALKSLILAQLSALNPEEQQDKTG